MALLVWTMVGLALWHFTVFLPDNFYGGIVGAFCGALLGSIIFGLIVNLGSVPGQNDTDLLTGVEAIPGTLLGLGLIGGSACASCARSRQSARSTAALASRRRGAVARARSSVATALRRPDRPQAVARAGERRTQVALGRAEGRREREVGADDPHAAGVVGRDPARHCAGRVERPANVQTKRPPGRSTRATSANVSRGWVIEPTPPEQSTSSNASSP